MPTYEYECRRCSRIFEVRQRISEPALSTCDRCGGPVHRLLAPAPFILKGGGWHVTDYPSEARKKALHSESGEKSSDGAEKKGAEKKGGVPSDASSSSSSSSSGSEGTSGGSGGTKNPTKPASGSS